MVHFGGRDVSRLPGVLRKGGEMKRGGPLKRYTQLKRGGPLRKRSKKTATRERKAADVRRRWKNQAGCCMVCGHSSHHPWADKPLALSKLVCHEISNGPLRQESLDKPFCIIVACAFCNQHELMYKSVWPEARQLCLLMIKAPERYNLVKYLEHTNSRAPNRITQSEVDEWRETIDAIPRYDPQD
jgi:hypothetical protein